MGRASEFLGRQVDRQTDRQTQTDRHRDRHTDRQTDRQRGIDDERQRQKWVERRSSYSMHDLSSSPVRDTR